jgi:general secretion pathway protein A
VRHRSRGWIAVGASVAVMLAGGAARAGSEAETAELLIKLIQAGRSVVSAHQDLINDPTKGDKGFTPSYFAEQTLIKFRETTGLDLSRPAAVPRMRLLFALLEAGKEVVADYQPVINKPGVAFKGFIPALWGRKTGEKFAQRTGIRVKLTATDYRFPGNRPDQFEAEVLQQFADPRYPRGQGVSRVVTMDGKAALRVMAPEYATARCLVCHGEPKGERDITGMKKEGYREGDLAGAISVILPVR